MAANRTLAGVLALSTMVLAAAGAALALPHTGGAVGLFLLAGAAADGVVAWLALGAPRTRRDVSV